MDKDVIQIMDTEKLIQERECLWNQRSEYYHSRDVQQRIWNEVAEESKSKGTYFKLNN